MKNVMYVKIVRSNIEIKVLFFYDLKLNYPDDKNEF